MWVKDKTHRLARPLRVNNGQRASNNLTFIQLKLTTPNDNREVYACSARTSFRNVLEDHPASL